MRYYEYNVNFTQTHSPLGAARTIYTHLGCGRNRNVGTFNARGLVMRIAYKNETDASRRRLRVRLFINRA